MRLQSPALEIHGQNRKNKRLPRRKIVHGKHAVACVGILDEYTQLGGSQALPAQLPPQPSPPPCWKEEQQALCNRIGSSKLTKRVFNCRWHLHERFARSLMPRSHLK